MEKLNEIADKHTIETLKSLGYGRSTNEEYRKIPLYKDIFIVMKNAVKEGYNCYIL